MLLTLASQVLAISVAMLQRQALHNEAASRRTISHEYDYIVVGAGSAGSIVATKLAQYGENVLLLEAGSAMNILNDIPSSFLLAMVPETDWGYSTVPQKHSGQMWANRKLPYYMGKVFGGSTSVSFMAHNRGNPLDFDQWETKYGCGREWSYRALLPYFRDTEKFANASNFPEGVFGTKGATATSYPIHKDPIHDRFQKAWNLEGLPTIDLNGPSQRGVATMQQTIDPYHNWFRSSAAHAYLYPNLHRKNLHIYANSLVTKVLLRNRKASGVEFRRNGETYTVKARKEVILSAGTVNTPKLLMLSGIGPKNHLKELGIDVVADLPVGEHFQDHALLTLPFLANNESLIDWGSNMFVRPTRTKDQYQFWVQKTGPLTARPFTAMYHSTPGVPENWPDTLGALYITQINEASLENYKASTNPAAWTNYYRPLVDDQRYFEVIIALFRHYSRGSIKLQSTDPLEAPLIDPNYLADKRDREAIVDLMARVYAMAEGAYFRKYAQPYRAVIPGCEKDVCPGSKLSTCRKYLACVARMKTQTSWCPTSGAPMGTHKKAVLNADLRVKGVERLRVIDASAVPEVANANSNAQVMALARKGADLILREAFMSETLAQLPVENNLSMSF